MLDYMFMLLLDSPCAAYLLGDCGIYKGGFDTGDLILEDC